MANSQFEKMVSSLSSLPGVGKKSAYRIAFHLLRIEDRQFGQLIASLQDTRDNLDFCQICGGLTEHPVCDICNSEKRDRGLICVVEQPEDIFFIENSGAFNGTFHVLNGVISPLDGIGPEQLRIKELIQRIDDDAVLEILLATNPTLEGDATASYIHNLIRDKGVRTTRIAHGITVGGTLEYADQYTLGKAIKARLTL